MKAPLKGKKKIIMSMTYDYQTRKIIRDWHLIRHGEICGLRDIRSRVGKFGCQNCPHNKGTEIDLNADIEDMYFTKCNHKDAKDSEGSGSLINQIYDRFEHEAMCAFYD